jgi:hypothetical protein
VKFRDLPSLALMAFIIVVIAFQACQTCQSEANGDVVRTGPS